MLRYAVVFLIVAGVMAVMGLGAMAAGAEAVAGPLFFGFLAVFLASLTMRLTPKAP